jgi:AAA+ superfamily predicted ATPase
MSDEDTGVMTTHTYQTTSDHLWDEFARVDQLLRAHTEWWLATVGASKPACQWGMLHVSDEEVRTYLGAPFIPPHILPAALAATLSPYWNQARALADDIELRKVEASDRTIFRLDRLQRLFALSDLERDILLVCLLPELDSRYRRLFGYLQDDASRTRPSVELVLRALLPTVAPEMARIALAPNAKLWRHHLLATTSEALDEPLSLRPLRVDDRIIAFLAGNDAPDARLRDVLVTTEGDVWWEDLILPEDRLSRLQGVADWWRQRREGLDAGTAIFLHGSYGSGRIRAARAIATAAGIPLLAVDVAPALRAALGWERIVDLSMREALLRGGAVLWSGFDALIERDQPPQRLDYLIAAAERFDGLTFFSGSTSWDPEQRFRDRLFLRFDFPTPGFAMRARLWSVHLPPPDHFVQPAPDIGAVAEALANGFQLTEGQVFDALATARSIAASRDPRAGQLQVADLYEACRRQSGRHLVTFARRIEPRSELTFDDLVLPRTSLRQIQELRARVRYRSRVHSSLGFERRLTLGKGLVVLFTGSTGTGKTTAAELLAREQGVDLYKVDLSSVISKYVGETEKNLARVFDEAEDANAILFFDEADALFGKRGEVKQAQDRWANLEVNYLLQRVEEYAGVVILASNLRQNIDDAFLRRIHSIVDFPFPDGEARFRLWRGMFPHGVSRPPDEDLRRLADSFRISGGSIKNVVVDAAFRAIEEGGTPTITIRHLVASVGREYQKLGKPITKGEFHSFFESVEQDIL